MSLKDRMLGYFRTPAPTAPQAPEAPTAAAAPQAPAPTAGWRRPGEPSPTLGQLAEEMLERKALPADLAPYAHRWTQAADGTPYQVMASPAAYDFTVPLRRLTARDRSQILAEPFEALTVLRRYEGQPGYLDALADADVVLVEWWQARNLANDTTDEIRIAGVGYLREQITAAGSRLLEDSLGAAALLTSATRDPLVRWNRRAERSMGMSAIRGDWLHEDRVRGDWTAACEGEAILLRGARPLAPDAAELARRTGTLEAGASLPSPAELEAAVVAQPEARTGTRPLEDVVKEIVGGFGATRTAAYRPALPEPVLAALTAAMVRPTGTYTHAASLVSQLDRASLLATQAFVAGLPADSVLKAALEQALARLAQVFVQDTLLRLETVRRSLERGNTTWLNDHEPGLDAASVRFNLDLLLERLAPVATLLEQTPALGVVALQEALEAKPGRVQFSTLLSDTRVRYWSEDWANTVPLPDSLQLPLAAVATAWDGLAAQTTTRTARR